MKKSLLLPAVGDRVRLKGRDPQGIVMRISDKGVNVVWDDGKVGPKIVPLYELEKL